MSNPTSLASTIVLLAFTEFLQLRKEEISRRLSKPTLQGLTELRQQVLSRLQGEPGVRAVMSIIETQGILVPDQLQSLVPALVNAMQADSAFAERICHLANAIISQEPGVSNLLGQNIQSVAGGTATQVNDSNAPTFTGSITNPIFHFHYGSTQSPQTSSRSDGNSNDKIEQTGISNTTSGDLNKSQPASSNFAVYKQEEWVGREEETDSLLKAIKGSCRITVILGITGIGKTALAERIIDGLRKNQGNFLRHNFEHDSISSNKSFIEVTKGWLRKLEENIPVQEYDLGNILSLLANKLCHSPYVILIDSLEYILTGNEDMGWGDFLDEGWNKFFLNILSADSCQSRFILTSQDLPLQLRQVGSHYPNFFSYQTLKGLEKSKQIELFQKQGLDCGEEEQSLLSRIGKAYMGHPLALQVIAREIKIDFHASVAGYWERFGFEIEEVEKSLEEATKGNTVGQDDWKLDSYSRELRIMVKKRLEITFERLKKNAYVAFELICKVSVYRRPERETAWLIQLQGDYDREEIRRALDILKDRALVEITYDPNRRTHLLGLHNLIRSQALYCRRQ